MQREKKERTKTAILGVIGGCEVLFRLRLVIHVAARKTKENDVFSGE